MNVVESKKQRRRRRKMRVRKKVFGMPERPRLSVYRSINHIYAQIIDDVAGCTLVEASTRSKELNGSLQRGGNVAAAQAVGKLLGERAKAKGLQAVTIDRNGYKYHGRIKALVDAVREAGLQV
jgi:large subunit ribosomal protein L18